MFYEVQHLKDTLNESIKLLTAALKTRININLYEDVLNVNFLAKILGCFHQSKHLISIFKCIKSEIQAEILKIIGFPLRILDMFV